MSAAADVRSEIAVGADRVPEPPAPGEYTKFRHMERGPRRQAAPPLVGVEVDFDAEQSAWLRDEANRTGLDYAALVRQLVDRARDVRRRSDE